MDGIPSPVKKKKKRVPMKKIRATLKVESYFDGENVNELREKRKGGETGKRAPNQEKQNAK